MADHGPPSGASRSMPLTDPVKDGRLFSGHGIEDLRNIGDSTADEVKAMLVEQLDRYDFIKTTTVQVKLLIQSTYEPLLQIYQQVLVVLGADRHAPYLDISQHELSTHAGTGHWRSLINTVNGEITSPRFYTLLTQVMDSASYDLAYNAKCLARPLSAAIDALHKLDRLEATLGTLPSTEGVQRMTDDQAVVVSTRLSSHIADVQNTLCNVYFSLCDQLEDGTTLRRTTNDAVNKAKETCSDWTAKSLSDKADIMERLIQNGLADGSLSSMSSPHYQDAWAVLVFVPTVYEMKQILDIFETTTLVRNGLELILKYVFRDVDFIDEHDRDYSKDGIPSRERHSLERFRADGDDRSENDGVNVPDPSSQPVQRSRSVSPSDDGDDDEDGAELFANISSIGQPLYGYNSFDIPNHENLDEDDEDYQQTLFAATVAWAKELPSDDSWTSDASFIQLGQILQALHDFLHSMDDELRTVQDEQLVATVTLWTCEALEAMDCSPFTYADAGVTNTHDTAWLKSGDGYLAVGRWLDDFNKYMNNKCFQRPTEGIVPDHGDPGWQWRVRGFDGNADSGMSPAQRWTVLVNWAKQLPEDWAVGAKLHDTAWTAWHLADAVTSGYPKVKESVGENGDDEEVEDDPVRQAAEDAEHRLLGKRLAQCLREVETDVWITNSPITTQWAMDSMESPDWMRFCSDCGLE